MTARLSIEKRQAIAKLLENRVPYRAIAKQLGVGVSSVQLVAYDLRRNGADVLRGTGLDTQHGPGVADCAVSTPATNAQPAQGSMPVGAPLPPSEHRARVPKASSDLVAEAWLQLERCMKGKVEPRLGDVQRRAALDIIAQSGGDLRVLTEAQLMAQAERVATEIERRRALVKP